MECTPNSGFYRNTGKTTERRLPNWYLKKKKMRTFTTAVNWMVQLESSCRPEGSILYNKINHELRLVHDDYTYTPAGDRREKASHDAYVLVGALLESRSPNQWWQESMQELLVKIYDKNWVSCVDSPNRPDGSLLFYKGSSTNSYRLVYQDEAYDKDGCMCFHADSHDYRLVGKLIKPRHIEHWFEESMVGMETPYKWEPYDGDDRCDGTILRWKNVDRALRVIYNGMVYDMKGRDTGESASSRNYQPIGKILGSFNKINWFEEAMVCAL